MDVRFLFTQNFAVLINMMILCSLMPTRGEDSDSVYAVLGENGETFIRPRSSALDGGRVKRTAAEPDDIKTLVDIHNHLRAITSASDMELMSWDPILAEMADLWAQTCIWDHGNPSGDWNHSYAFVGQNLWVSTGALELEGAVQDWYDEILDYTYSNITCAEGKVCGHYTQVVWSNTRTVGCAWSFCPNMTNLHYKDASYLVCNYGPGQLSFQKPYLEGPACSECGVGQYWCYEDTFCRSDCVEDNTPCSCNTEACDNCGVMNTTNCACECQDGYTGDKCTEICQNNHEWCEVYWLENSCGHPDIPWAEQYCLAMCGICNAAPLNESGCITTTPEPTTTTPEPTTTTPEPTTTTPEPTTTTPEPTTTTPEPTTTTPEPTTTTHEPTTTTPEPTTTTPEPTTTTPEPTTTTPEPTTTTPESTTTTPEPTTTTPEPTTTTPEPTTTTPEPTTTTPTTTPEPTTTTPEPTTPEPTTSTPEPTTTTPEPTTPSPDCTDYCINGGSPSISDNQCQCRCTEEWQGDQCQENREQASFAVSVAVSGFPLRKWGSIWDWLNPLLVGTINSYCNLAPGVCCGLDTSSRYTNLEYTNSEAVQVADGYPKRLGRRRFKVAIIAYATPGNELCATARNDLLSRRKRQLDDGDTSVSLPQDALLAIVESVEGTISSTLIECCNATLEAVEKTEVEPIVTSSTTTTQKASENDSDLLVGIIASAVVLGLILLTIFIVLVICACMKGRNTEPYGNYVSRTKSGDTEHYSDYSSRTEDPYTRGPRAYRMDHPGLAMGHPSYINRKFNAI